MFARRVFCGAFFIFGVLVCQLCPLVPANQDTYSLHQMEMMVYKPVGSACIPSFPSGASGIVSVPVPSFGAPPVFHTFSFGASARTAFGVPSADSVIWFSSPLSFLSLGIGSSCIMYEEPIPKDRKERGEEKKKRKH